MSWLYSLVFAGILFSSQDKPLNTAPRADLIERATAIAATQGDETERFEQTYPLTPNGRVSVSNVNGSIVINAWDRNEVKLVAVKTADTKERLASVEIKIDAKADSLSVETNYDSWKNNGTWRNGGKLKVDYELTVPRGAALNEIETVNGSVTVADFSNVTKISAVNGNVKATNLRGTANLSTVNGEVFADFDRLETGSKIYLDTVNGTVNLSIPSDSNATLRADSVNGGISNEFGLPVRKGKYVGRDLYGRLGSGDVQVKLSSVNGPLSIGRNKDGKSASPATDLLPQKNKDDQDLDNDDDKDDSDDNDATSVDTAKLNRDVAKAVKTSTKAIKNSQKQVAAAVKLAQDEIRIEAPVIPEIKINTEALEKATEAINAADVRAQVDAAVRVQSEVMARIRDTDFSGMPRIEKKSNSIPVKGVPKVTIAAPDCSVRVRGWDKSEVQYTVVKFTDNLNRAPIQMKEDHSDSAVNISVVSTGPTVPNDDRDRVRIEVFVPKRSDIKITTDREIRIEGVSGAVDLSGTQESIDVRDVDGKMNVWTASGQVRVIGFHGDLDARTKEGSLYLEGDFNQLSAHAADGTVTLTLPANANASIVSNTEVESEGIDLVKEDDSIWRMGNGERKYNFDFDEGHLIVRSTSEVANY